MRIAVAADLHLTSHEDHPERYHALENILERMSGERVDRLVLAGDLFHETSQNYAEFEKFCRQTQYRHVHFHIIPGNHDRRLTPAMFAAENIIVHSDPEIQRFDLMSLPFLFLPYQKAKTMGEMIAPFVPELAPEKWVLISHGDWVEGMREINPIEPGVYMPLTRTDLESYRPLRAILGHLHKPIDRGIVHYPGSPCPLDVTETGRRRFLIVDSDTGAVMPEPVDADVLYFQASLLVLPVEDEQAYLTSQIESHLKTWDVTEAEKSRARIRVKVQGYTADKKRVMETVKTGFRGFTFYEDAGPDLGGVSLSEDMERAEIASRVLKTIEGLEWPGDEREPSKDQILLEALHVIYGD